MISFATPVKRRCLMSDVMMSDFFYHGCKGKMPDVMMSGSLYRIPAVQGCDPPAELKTKCGAGARMLSRYFNTGPKILPGILFS